MRNHRVFAAWITPVRGLLATICILPSVLSGQDTTPKTTSTEPTDIIELSPFVVSSEKDEGYTASSALAGGRTDTPLKNTPSAISVLTSEFLRDVAATNLTTVAEWAVNSNPDQVGPKTSFNFDVSTLRMRGLGSSYGSRNYFRWYIDSDSYNTERFEFARGPNSVLFGDGNLAGIVTTWTKVPRLNQKFVNVSAQVNSWNDGWRTTLDVNQPITKTIAIRVNALKQDMPDWRDNTKSTRSGLTLATAWKATANTSFRVEGEWGEGNRTFYTTSYTDNSSYWNGTTNYNGVTTPSTNGTGIGRFTSGTTYNVYARALGDSAQFLNWATYYRTNGTGIILRPMTRADLPNSATVSSREFNLQPKDSEGVTRFYTYTLFADHAFSKDFFVQLAYNRAFNERKSFNSESLFSTYQVDVNTVLPNGAANPMYGKAFADSTRNIRDDLNTIDDVRAIATWKFERNWIQQRVSGIIGSRRDVYASDSDRLYRTNGTGQYTASANLFYQRVYWDAPQYDLGGIPEVAGYTFDYLPTSVTRQRNLLDYAQVASTTQFFNKRLTLMAGARRDKAKTTQSTTSGLPVDPVTGLPRMGATVLVNGVPTAVLGAKSVVDAQPTSYNGGAVFFLTQWLGVYGNYSETFSTPGSGANLIDGQIPGISRSSGYDAGLKLELFDGRLSGTINYYDTTQANSIAYYSTYASQFNRLWTNVGHAELATLNYRDTRDYIGKGLEVDLTARPIRNLSVMFNIAFPKTKAVNMQPGTNAYFNQNLATWQAGADDLTNPNRTTIAADIATIRAGLASDVPGVVLNNTYDYTANVYASYYVSKGTLKGLSIGGGANVRSRSKIGNTLLSSFDYLYSEPFTTISLNAGYTYSLAKNRRLRFQLNVANLLDEDKIITTSYSDFRVGGLSTNPLQRVPNGFRYLDPRRFTFTTTIEL